MIDRTHLKTEIREALTRNRIVAIVGPRQAGKTTLAREFLPADSLNYFDLEDPASLRRLEEPMVALQPLSGLVVIDEIQRAPDIFPILRVLADRANQPAQFLILGSASGDLLRQSSESLAGRMHRIIVTGFLRAELKIESDEALWLLGGFPLSYLAPDEQASLAWRRGFVDALLERDFPQWGVRTPALAIRRFWTLLAHYHGQIWNAAEAARALGLGESTARRYLDLLTDAFMVRQLPPYFANIKKRQVKSPKLYFRDSGLLHLLLGINTRKELHTHPKIGASWEGYVLEQVLATIKHDEAFFWATHQGAEIDLVLRRGSSLIGVEIKRADAPGMTRSLNNALQDLGLERAYILYPGEQRYPVAEKVEALPLSILSDYEAF